MMHTRDLVIADIAHNRTVIEFLILNNTTEPYETSDNINNPLEIES